MECSRPPWSLEGCRLKIQLMPLMPSVLLQTQTQYPSPLRSRQKTTRLRHWRSRSWHIGQHKSELLRGEWVASHPRRVTEPINEPRPVLLEKSPACHGAVVSPQPSLTDISRNRAADEDAASPSAPLVRHEGRARTALTFRFLYWCQHRCALTKYARWSGVADRLHNTRISIKHWHTVKHWLNNNQNHAIPKLRWISMLLYP